MEEAGRVGSKRGDGLSYIPQPFLGYLLVSTTTLGNAYTTINKTQNFLLRSLH